jgi:hypothetical protein
MNTYTSLTSRQRAQLNGLALLAFAALITILAVVAPLAALALSLSLLAGTLLLVLSLRQGRVEPRRVATADVGAADATPQLPVQITLEDGALHVARVVPSAANDEHTLLLTRNGYLVVNASGQVVHTIKA